MGVNTAMLYVSSVIFGGVGAWIVGRYAASLGLIDLPNQRSSHVRPTPKGGGIGILAAFAVASPILKIPLAFWLPAALLSILSFLGDRVEISFRIRLVAQFAAALVAILGGVRLDSSIAQSDPSAYVVVLLIPLCAVYIVGTANFYNFMDGINGISAVTGIVGFGLIAVHTGVSGTTDAMAILAICVAFSCLVFLPFNMPRARVFMGDVGAILLGFAFASMAVALSGSFLDFVCLSALLFP